MDVFLIVFSLVLAVVLGVVSMTLLKGLKDVSRELKRANDRLEELEARVVAQEALIREVRLTVEKSPPGPWGDLPTIAAQFARKGLVPGLFTLGTSIFRAYLGRKQAPKALPASNKKKV